MTVKELYEWAKKHDCLDCDIGVQYRDYDGLYYGREYDLDPEVEWKADDKKVVILLTIKRSLFCRKKENTL